VMMTMMMMMMKASGFFVSCFNSVMSALLGGGGLGHPTKRMDGRSPRPHQPVRCCFSLNLPATQVFTCNFLHLQCYFNVIFQFCHAKLAQWRTENAKMENAAKIADKLQFLICCSFGKKPVSMVYATRSDCCTTRGGHPAKCLKHCCLAKHLVTQKQ